MLAARTAYSRCCWCLIYVGRGEGEHDYRRGSGKRRIGRDQHPGLLFVLPLSWGCSISLARSCGAVRKSNLCFFVFRTFGLLIYKSGRVLQSLKVLCEDQIVMGKVLLTGAGLLYMTRGVMVSPSDRNSLFSHSPIFVFPFFVFIFVFLLLLILLLNHHWG